MLDNIENKNKKFHNSQAYLPGRVAVIARTLAGQLGPTMSTTTVAKSGQSPAIIRPRMVVIAPARCTIRHRIHVAGGPYASVLGQSCAWAM